jgi:hypothetical protein
MAGGIFGTAALNQGEKINNMALHVRHVALTNNFTSLIRSVILILSVLVAAR